MIIVFIILSVASLLLLIAVDGTNHYGFNYAIYVVLAVQLGLSGAIFYEMKKKKK